MQLEVMWHKSPVISTAPNYRPLQTAIGTTCRVRPIFPIGYRPLLTSTGWYPYWPIILILVSLLDTSSHVMGAKALRWANKCWIFVLGSPHIQQPVAASRPWFRQRSDWHRYDLLEVTAAAGLVGSVVDGVTCFRGLRHNDQMADVTMALA